MTINIIYPKPGRQNRSLPINSSPIMFVMANPSGEGLLCMSNITCHQSHHLTRRFEAHGDHKGRSIKSLCMQPSIQYRNRIITCPVDISKIGEQLFTHPFVIGYKREPLNLQLKQFLSIDLVLNLMAGYICTQKLNIYSKMIPPSRFKNSSKGPDMEIIIPNLRVLSR